MANVTAPSIARRNIAAMARESADKAVQVMIDALSDEDVKVRLDAASKLLDRAVGRPPQAIIGGDEDDPAINIINRIERVILAKNAQN